MNGSLKALHCPYEKLVPAILNGGELKAKDHLKFICMFFSQPSPFNQSLQTER